MSLRARALQIAAISLLGCGQADDGGAAHADAGVDAAVAPQSGAGGTGGAAGTDDVDAGGAGGSPTMRPQTNVSFDSAQRVSPGDEPVLQDERSVDQVDYFVFTAQAGAFYEITTDRGRFMPDNTIALHDGERRLIATNDDGGMGAGPNVDSRLVVRIAESGDYYVTVEDVFTPESFFGSGFPLLFYHFAIRELTDETPGVAIAHDGAAVSVSFVEDAASGYGFALLLGDPGDAELSFDLEGGAGKALIGSVLPAGPEGNGSTLEAGELRVLDDDDHVLARIDRALGQLAFHPPVGDATYQLRIGTTDAPGANAFHAIDLVLLPDNPSEQAEASNDDRSEAEPIAFLGGTWRRGLVLLQLPTGDEDHFLLEGRQADLVTVVCEAESGGSGVRGLQVELLNDKGVPIASGRELSAANVELETGPLAEAAPLYLHLWSEEEADAEVEPWARCAIDMGP